MNTRSRRNFVSSRPGRSGRRPSRARLFIGYESALYFWLRGSQGLWTSEPCRNTSLAQCAYNASEVLSFGHPREPFGPDPLHIMVDDSSKRRDTQQQKCHVHAASLPEKSFVDIGRGVFVASPALCFLQVASSRSFFELAELGYELCGGYSRTPGIGPGFVQRANILTTPQRIGNLLKALPGASGSRSASKALRYIMPNSKSPAETDMALKAVLPYRLGGYGFPLAELNPRIDLTQEAAAIAHRQSVCPDMLWRKASLCLEYDSTLHHESAQDRIRDSLKRNALGCMGYKVITVTPSQLKSVTEFNGIATEISQCLGKRLKPLTPEAKHQRFLLNDAIRKRMHDDLQPVEWPYV